MSLTRRAMLGALPALGVPAMAVTAAGAGSVPEGAEPPLQAVVHVNFPDTGRQGAGLKNIENVLRELGAAGGTFVVVCHGAGIGLVEAARSDHREAVQALVARGVGFVACRNTMKQKSIQPEDLIAGVTTVPSGALEVIRRQQAGFAYFRP